MNQTNSLRPTNLEMFINPDPFFSKLDSMRYYTWPACEIETSEKSHIYYFDIPGVEPENISVEVGESSLTVSGKRESKFTERNENTFKSERVYGDFSRTFNLPPDVQTEGIKAGYEDGVLKIEIPKTNVSTPKSKRIEISTSNKRQ